VPIDVNECPACGAADFTVAGIVAPGFNAHIGGADFVQPDYEIRDCVSCGLLFRSPTLSTGELSDFYARMDFRVWETAGFYPTERAVLARIRELPSGSRLLDFGCSSGRLLAPLADNYQCCGIEINRDAAAVARAKGLCILSECALDSEPEETFDAIIMVDIFEHLVAPVQILCRLVRLLKPKGRLFVVTGNGDSPACRLDPGQFWYFRHMVHVCMLTFRHAQFIAAKLRLKLEAWEVATHYDERLPDRLLQYFRHWSYWQFQRQTLVSRTILPMIPFVRRARGWAVAPQFSVTKDHVVAIFQKGAR
jgi:SAM-dependent methyltransferase